MMLRQRAFTIFLLLSICWSTILLLGTVYVGKCKTSASNTFSKSRRDTAYTLKDLGEQLGNQHLSITSEIQAAFKETGRKGGNAGETDLSNSRKSVDYGLRAIRNQIEDLWYYVQRQNHIQSADVLEDIRWRKIAALLEVELLQRDRDLERDRELGFLRTTVRQRILEVQAQLDCTNAKKLLCTLGSRCGFGCQMHRVAICFTIALGAGRMLIVDDERWAYAGRPWKDVFQPITSCAGYFKDAVLWNDAAKDENMEQIPVIKIDGFNWQVPPSYLPLRIPTEFEENLVQSHGDPSAWWMGQLVSYLIRPNEWLNTTISNYQTKIGFESPIAGIHVRRTDKITHEASFHDISEYMVHVVDWFDKEWLKRKRLSMPPMEKRRVYIASDDPTVWEDAKNRYPNYTFIGDIDISVGANKDAGRYSMQGVKGVMVDVMLLSRCDYFVGTFSSGMSRLVYELMQVHHTDPTTKVHSLDDRYYYIEQFRHQQRAVYDHVSRSSEEIDINIGDIIDTRGNHWDGLSLGTNTRTGRTGLYPSYKTEEIVPSVDFNINPWLKANDKQNASHIRKSF